MTSNVFYASIPDPNEFRKDVLLAQKCVIDSLKKHEHIKVIRAEKEVRISELKKILGSLKTIATKLKTALPAHGLKQKAPKVVHSAPARKEAVQRKSKIQILEDELAKIEGKLGSLE